MRSASVVPQFPRMLATTQEGWMIDSESAQEAAKAVQEVAKATQSAIDASREAGGFLAKYLDDPH